MIFTPLCSRAEPAVSIEFRDAVQALSDGAPSLAAQKLESLLKNSGQTFNDQKRQKITLLLLQALVRAGKNEQALLLFSEQTTLQQNKTAQFWNALALTENGQNPEAQRLLQLLIAEPAFQYRDWGTLALAQNLAAQGNSKKAHGLLKSLLNSPQPGIAARAQLLGAEFYLQQQQSEAALALLNSRPNSTSPDAPPDALRFLRARIAMQMGDFPKAISYLESFRKNENPASQSIHQKAVMLLGDACLSVNQKQEAIRHYLHLIKDHPDSPLLPSAFDELAQIEAFSLPELSQILAQWANEDAIHPERQTYSQYYQAQEFPDKLKSFAASHPHHPLFYPTSLKLAELLIRQNKTTPQPLLSKLLSSPLSADQHSKVASLQALSAFKQGDFVKAESKFIEASHHKGSTRPSAIASYNVALTALYADDNKTFIQYENLLKQSNKQALQAEFLLEQGLFLAARSLSQAFETLSLFLDKFPNHARAADAHLALAELYLNEVPPKPVSAREHLNAATDYKLSQQQEESLDYIAVWIEESDGNHSAIIEQALRYLDHWPNSQRTPEIRLKLGGAYYQEKDYFQAVSAFVQLADNHPESPLYGPALFSAGKAASLSRQPAERTRAIELWAKLAENESSPLALHARHEQGILKLKLDEFDDAIAAFDSILDHDPPAPLELKLAVWADRGQALFNIATSQNNNPDQLLDAIQSFDSIISANKASPSWRNQAAVRKAKCLERLGRLDDALNTYNDVVQSDRLNEGSDSDAPVAQVEWFFRAGLGAIRLLLEKKEWRSAIRIADSLANSGSPRAIEAAKLADHIRLKHFIWDRPER